MRQTYLEEAYEPFLQHMRNRLDATQELRMESNVPRMTAIVQLIRIYADTGNTRALVDISNLAMVEFWNPEHPKANYPVIASD